MTALSYLAAFVLGVLVGTGMSWVNGMALLPLCLGTREGHWKAPGTGESPCRVAEQ